MLVLVANLVLAGVDAWVIGRLRRSRDRYALAQAFGAMAFAVPAVAVAGMLTQEHSRFFGAHFALIGLLTWGIFLHGPLVLAAAAIALRARARGWSLASAAAAAGILAVGVDAFAIEPHRLEITRYEVGTAKLDRPLRIVVLSDLQTDHVGEYERRVVRTALDLEPDLLVLPGDYLQIRSPEAYDEEARALNAMLRREGLAAPLGVVAVEGNVDPPGWERLFDGLGVAAERDTKTLELGGVSVTALSFRASFDRGLRVAPRDGFHVVVGHAPDYALGDVEADLLIAGHTHGGQVRIPGFGPPLTLSAVPRAWAAGRTDLGGGRTLVVSRGVGMERGLAPPVRFFCPPELVVIDVVPRGQAERRSVSSSGGSSSERVPRR